MPPSQRFHTGERIPYSGIYRVIHASHRLPHEVTLLDGETFPRCLKCDTAVQFELVKQAPDILYENAFRVVLFGLPPVEAEEPDVNAPVVDTEPSEILPSPAENQEEKSEDVTSFAEWPKLVRRQRLKAKQTNVAADPRIFKPGDLVPEDGIYSVEHAPHRLLHQATLAKDARFPRCRTCANAVRFRLIRRVNHGCAFAVSSSSILEEFEEPSESAEAV